MGPLDKMAKELPSSNSHKRWGIDLTPFYPRSPLFQRQPDQISELYTPSKKQEFLLDPGSPFKLVPILPPESSPPYLRCDAQPTCRPRPHGRRRSQPVPTQHLTACRSRRWTKSLGDEALRFTLSRRLPVLRSQNQNTRVVLCRVAYPSRIPDLLHYRPLHVDI